MMLINDYQLIKTKLIRKWLSVLLFCSLSSYWATAQDIILTQEDKEEIRYQTKDIIDQLESLMNLIKDPNLGEFNKSKIINHSYSDHVNQIFVDANVIIEDDINPNFYNWKHQKNVRVGKYLKDFELFYEKNTQKTVSFSNVQAFEVQQKEYVYVPVYFEVNYTGKHLVIDKPYNKGKRVATIIAIKEGELWKTLIASISFYNPKIHLFFQAVPAKNAILAENSLKEKSLTYTGLNFEKPKALPFFKKYKQVMRRGVIQYLSWENNGWIDGHKLELIKDGEVVMLLDEKINRDNHFWKVPKDMPLNDSYKYKLTSINEPSNVVYSDDLKVKRGFPVGARIAIVVLVLGTVAIFISN